MTPYMPLLIPLESCVKPNSKLSGPMGGLMNDVSGAVVGLMPPLAIAITVIVAVLGIVTVLTPKGREYLGILPRPFAIAIGAVIMIALGMAGWSIVLQVSC